MQRHFAIQQWRILGKKGAGVQFTHLCTCEDPRMWGSIQIKQVRRIITKDNVISTWISLKCGTLFFYFSTQQMFLPAEEKRCNWFQMIRLRFLRILYLLILPQTLLRVYNKKRPVSAGMKTMKYEVIFKGRWNQRRLSTSCRNWMRWSNTCFVTAIPWSHSSAVLCTRSRFSDTVWTKSFPKVMNSCVHAHMDCTGEWEFSSRLRSTQEGLSKSLPSVWAQPQSFAVGRSWSG